MALFEHFPYINFHDLNLDWIIGRIKNIETAEANAASSAESAAASETSAAASAASAAASAEFASMIPDALQDLAVTNARLDNIITDNQETEGNTELIDIRTAENGKIYLTAGSAVRGQFAALLQSLEAHNIESINPSFEDGYLNSAGNITASPVYKVSELIHIPAGYQLIFNSHCSEATYHFCEYDSDGTFLSVGTGYHGIGTRTGIKIDADSDRYVKICTNTDYISVEQCDPHIVPLSSEPTGVADISNVGPATGVEFVAGYLSTETHQRVGSDVYMCSSLIYLQKDQTIEFDCGGSSGASLIVKYTREHEWIENVFVGDLAYHRLTYTADADCWIRICSRTAAGGNYAPPEVFQNVKFYYKDLLYKNEKLRNKKIVVIGDSMIRGNNLGPGASWPLIMTNKTGANCLNYGINGNTVSNVSGGSGTPMCQRYADIPDINDADVVIFEGGANDFNNNAPIGTAADTVDTTFMGAVNTIIDGVRTMNPRARLLFMTTYNRFKNANGAGLHYIDYVSAMKEACYKKSVPCYDNFGNAGIDFEDANLASWADEGVYLNLGRNRHLSPAGYDRIYPLYKHYIEEQF